MLYFRSMVLAIFLWSMQTLVFSQVHTTYLWHLEQPVYWPETSTWNPYQYQKVWESDYLKNNGGNQYSDGLQHPLNNLQEIFGNDDRKAVYQYRAKDAVQSLLGHPEAGAQVSYSGCLMENVQSLADAGQWGYSQGWQNNFTTARGWTTSTGKPRMDMVGFSMNHALSPLVSEKMLRKQIQAHRYLSNEIFGTNPNYSKGYWPAEGAFSVRIIKALAEEGFEWSIIANSHLARTLNDYPLQFGTAGCNIDPPNLADKVQVNGNNWWSGQIDGRGGAFAAPYCYQAHKARYVDPETGTEYKLTVVPMDDLLSYQNGYSLMGTSDIDSHIAPFNDPAHPSLVLLAHDGDNAWGGGYDYYSQSVPGFANEAASKGYVPTTIQHFLTQHPVPENDVVHVEDGSWFNAANDWGHPQFINWLWPMYTAGYQFNPNGWTEDARNWAVLVAAENRVQMAEDLQGNVSIANIVHPSAVANPAERAWHHLLPAYNSGYMYYGTSLDMEVKQTLACNKANGFANQVINAHASTDLTPPTVFIPQRYPYNPGSIGFGPTYAYQQHQNPSDFFVWTFAYDVSGIQTAVLKYRVDNDGLNPLNNDDNDTYSGGSSVQPWQSLPMNYREFPTGNVTNNPDISFFILPDYIAGEYYAQITGLNDTLVDYYVEMTDNHGNVFKTPIQHVYVGSGGGSATTGVTWSPQNPTVNDTITITETGISQGAMLHWGVNAVGSSWQMPDAIYRPAGSALFNGTGPAVESAMTGPGASATNVIRLGPFNQAVQNITGVDFVFHYNNNTWNNNGGQNFHIPILPAADTFLLVTPAAQTIGATASSASFNVTSNTGWTALSDQPWCVPTSGGSGNGVLQLICQTNTTTQSRTASITVTGISASPVMLTLTQEAAELQVFTVTLANDQQVSDHSIEFDVMLTLANPSESFELGGVQVGIQVNTDIKNGGTLIATVVPGSSELLSAQQPAFISMSENNDCIRISAMSPPSAGNGSILTISPVRVCRVRLENSVSFALQSPDLSFCLSASPYETLVSRYVNGVNTLQGLSSLNCFSTCSNALLNADRNLLLTVFVEGLCEETAVMHQARNSTAPQWGSGIADQISVELHDAADYSVIAYSFPAVNLMTDGTAVISAGMVGNGSYYITVKHRNSLSVVSALPVSFTGSIINYSFDHSDKVYGNRLKPLSSGVWAMYTGDTDNNNVVDAADLNLLHSASQLFETGYLVTDLNGDGLIDSSDLIIVDNNASVGAHAEWPE